MWPCQDPNPQLHSSHSDGERTWSKHLQRGPCNALMLLPELGTGCPCTPGMAPRSRATLPKFCHGKPCRGTSMILDLTPLIHCGSPSAPREGPVCSPIRSPRSSRCWGGIRSRGQRGCALVFSGQKSGRGKQSRCVSKYSICADWQSSHPRPQPPQCGASRRQTMII